MTLRFYCVYLFLYVIYRKKMHGMNNVKFHLQTCESDFYLKEIFFKLCCLSERNVIWYD
jgi:hypothetical protein